MTAKEQARDARNEAARHAIAFLKGHGNREQQAKDWKAAQDAVARAQKLERQ